MLTRGELKFVSPTRHPILTRDTADPISRAAAAMRSGRNQVPESLPQIVRRPAEFTPRPPKGRAPGRGRVLFLAFRTLAGKGLTGVFFLYGKSDYTTAET